MHSLCLVQFPNAVFPRMMLILGYTIRRNQKEGQQHQHTLEDPVYLINLSVPEVCHSVLIVLESEEGHLLSTHWLLTLRTQMPETCQLLHQLLENNFRSRYPLILQSHLQGQLQSLRFRLLLSALRQL